MLIIEDLHTFLGKSHILQGVSLEVTQGMILGILGRNGVGKTTLIRSIIGFVPTSKGKIILNQEDITFSPPYVRVRKGMGLVPQGRLIFPSLRVRENLIINVPLQRRGYKSVWTLDTILDRFPRLRERLHHHGNQLSGGEQQILAIGRALMGNPGLLLLDEPSEGLAPLIVEEIRNLIHDLKAQGIAVLLVEQNFNFAIECADQILLMNKGQIVYRCAPFELVENEEIRQTYLGI